MISDDDDNPIDEHPAPTAEDGQDSLLGEDPVEAAIADDTQIETPVEQAAAPSVNTAYRVLARKYRPHHFGDLVGQDAMVQTLKNAFSSGRIAQAYMLSGLRGIGKTTTARIIARALNYDGVVGHDGPSVDMPEYGMHCADIMASRHMDVLEMDAASNRGIGDIRELISNVQYAPVLARYKVYILDEVHMLTTEAFNALLKTLEEPPAHVKFIFATTDPRKVPVTILSRCQRFDLKRLDQQTMTKHLSGICEKESVTADEDALSIIARSSEGSVRDALSLLDQSIVLSDGHIKASHIQDMLGLADGMRTVELVGSLMSGEIKTALEQCAELIDHGAEASRVIVDIGDVVHAMSRAKVIGASLDTFPGYDSDAQEKLAALSASLSQAVLSRSWQMLLAGIEELKRAPNPAMALEMLIIRIGYAAHLPPPDRALIDAAKSSGTASPSPSVPTQGSQSQNGPAGFASTSQQTIAVTKSRTVGSSALQVVASNAEPQPKTDTETERGLTLPRFDKFEDVVAFVGEKRDIKLKHALETQVIAKAFGKGHMGLALKSHANADEIRQLGEKMFKWTGQRWMIALSEAEGHQQTLKEEQDALVALECEEAAERPEVKAILEHFPGAKVSRVRRIPLADSPEAEFIPSPDSAGEEDDDYLDF